jgi:hypothetical protein
MTSSRERLFMALLFTGLPVLLYGLVIRPSTRRVHLLHERLRAANEAYRDFQTFTPVSQAERALLEDPGAPWRARMPLLDGDGARLAHANRVVSELSSSLKARGLNIASLRATWEPITADFTLPGRLAPGPLAGRLAPGPLAGPAAGDAPEHQLSGWALEVELPGATGQLFKALAPLAQVNPLLEPVGLRWELAAQPGAGQTRTGHRQFLILRNFYLKP